jgi:hypothetical protein
MLFTIAFFCIAAPDEGPRLSPSEFLRMISPSAPGLGETVRLRDGGQEPEALEALAAYLRAREEPADFGSRGGREAGFHRGPAERALRHEVKVGGIPHAFGPEIDWGFNPTTVSGSRYDRDHEWTWQLNRHSEWVTLARAYRATGDEVFAREFDVQITGWMVRCPVPEGKADQAPFSKWRTIEAGIRMGSTWPMAFTVFRRSPSVRDETVIAMARSIAEHARYLKAHPTSGNWLTMEMNGLFHAGCLLDFLEEARPWRDASAGRLREELDRQVYPDGAQVELSPGYHNVALRNFLGPATIAGAYRHALPSGYVEGLERMYAYDLWAMTPDRNLPRWNDSWDVDVKGLLEEGHRLFPGRADFEWIASDGKAGRPPDHASHWFPWAGQAVLRSGWDRDALFLGFEAGPFGYGHQHEDKLGIVVQAGAKRLLVEAGSYAYDASKWRAHVLSSRAHNLILVDGKEQARRGRPRSSYVSEKPIDGGFRSGDRLDYARGVYDEGFGPDRENLARHEREVAFLREAGAFVVRDTLTSLDEKPHRYEAIFQLDAPSVEIGPDGRRAETGGDWPRLLVLAAGDPGPEVRVVKGQEKPEILGWIPQGHGIRGVRPIPALIHERRGAETVRFLTVLQPLREASADRAVGVSWSETAVSVTFAGGRRVEAALPPPAGEPGGASTPGEARSGKDVAGPKEWTLPPMDLPRERSGTVVACTREELGRLREAYASTGPQRAPVAAAVDDAKKFLEKKLDFPLRGGQHNQWYQCDRCQLALETVDPARHRCPKCGTVYTGEPYDDVVFARVHHENLSGASDAAWAFAITGERRFVEKAREVLLGYAERYRSYPYHTASRSPAASLSSSGGRLFEQTLTEASSLTQQIAPAFDLIAGSDVLSDGDRASIRDGLIAPMLESIGRYRAGKSNWQSWHNAAMLWAGAVIGDATWVRRALTDPGNGFAEQMRISVTAEGMWYENSWGYHIYTLSALLRTAEGARRLGIDLWSCPALRKMVRLPFAYSMPDGSLPRFGDDVHTTVAGAARLLEPLIAAGAEPDMIPYLPGRPTWDAVLFGRKPSRAREAAAPASAVFPSAGHAILRARGDAGLTAAITFGPYGGFHGHLDKLSFVLFGFGEELGVDPGRARSQAYRLPIHRDWYKATVGHNAVLVDGRSQDPAEGKLDLFAVREDRAAVAASCTKAYKGVEGARLLVAAPGYLLVVDDIRASTPRRFDWIYHNRGAAVRCPAAAGAGELPEGLPGREYIEGVSTGTTSEPVRAVFEGAAVDVHLLAAGGAETAVAIGNGPAGSVRDRAPLAILSRKGERAVFGAALEPVRKGAAPANTVVTVAAAGDEIEVRVSRRGEVEVIRWGPPSRIAVEAGGGTVLESR